MIHQFAVGTPYAKSGVVKLQTVKTALTNVNMIIPKSRVALESWLADLRRSNAVSDLGAVFLALQISELENKCASLRKRMNQKAEPETNNHSKKRALRSAA